MTLALPGFYCKNKGHQPSYVPFLAVNDGVCDYDRCCDGSDEWDHVGGTSCPDRCKELAKEWKRLDEQRHKALGASGRKRKELVVEAQRLRQEVEDQIKALKTQMEASRVSIRQLETTLRELERKEGGKVVKSTGTGNPAAVLAGLAKQRIEELREALINVRSQRDSGRARIQELETILSTFKQDYNPNFNDEGVKRTVRSWEEYAARDRSSEGGDAAHDRDLDEITKPDHETGAINWNEWEKTEESDVELRRDPVSFMQILCSSRSSSLQI